MDVQESTAMDRGVTLWGTLISYGEDEDGKRIASFEILGNYGKL